MNKNGQKKKSQRMRETERESERVRYRQKQDCQWKDKNNKFDSILPDILKLCLKLWIDQGFRLLCEEKSWLQPWVFEWVTERLSELVKDWVS